MVRRSLVAAIVMLTTALWASAALAQGKIDLKLISRSHAENEILWRKGFTLEDSALRDEVQALLDTLTAGHTVDPAIKLRVNVFNSPELNAFAMPDGSIYVFVGLLARLNSMDELAFVIGHEATHAIAWHGQKNIEQAKGKSAMFQVLSLTTSIVVGSSGWSGAGLIDMFSQLGLTLVAAASITGYSRALESEADRRGYQLLCESGRDGCASVGALRIMLAEGRNQSSVANFFWGSHPRTIDRISAIESTIGTACATDTAFNNDYAHIKYPMLKLRARMWNRADMPRRAMKSATPYLAVHPEDAEIHCIIGDALATTANADTLKLAAESYGQALELGGASYREPLLGLARVAEARRDTLAVIDYLDRYVAGGVDVPKRRSTRRRIEELKAAYHWVARTSVDSLETDAQEDQPHKEE